MKTLLDSSVNHLLIGQVLQERYQILEVLNHGAFSQTYLAQDLILGNHPLCIIKFYHEYSNSSYLYATSLRLFLKEARNLQILEGNAQIPQLLDCFEKENQGLYLVQEYIEGQLLSEILPSQDNSAPLWTEKQVWSFIYELLKIISFVHRRGLIHGDLKPANLIKRNLDHRLVLIDFGSAHSVAINNEVNEDHETEKPTLRATISISPSGYVAPEQLIGEYYPNSDFYAIGMMAIQALTGLEPTQLQLNLDNGELIWESLWQHESTITSQQLTRIINRMICYRYQDRYQDATEAIKDLEVIHIPEEPPIVIFSQCQWPGIPNAKNKSESPLNPLSVVKEYPQLELEIVSTTEETTTESSTTTQEQVSPKIVPIDDFAEDLNKFAFDAEKESRQSKYLPLVAGIGITLIFVNALALSWGIQNLLNAFEGDSGVKLLVKANQAYQEGNIEQAISLAKSIKEDSAAYAESQNILENWQKEWDLASNQLQTIEKAYEGKDWQVVVNTAKNLPQIAYWQNRALPLVKEAQLQIDVYSHHLLQEAFNAASSGDFTTALRFLEKISPDSKLGTKVQAKLVEYREKEQIRSQYYLQQAYNHAQKRDFETALEFLERIPPEAKVSQIAEAKMAEYKYMQWIKEEVARRAALRQAVSNQAKSIVNWFLPQDWQITSNHSNPGMQLQEITTSHPV